MSQSGERILVEIFGSTYSLHGGSDPASVRAIARDLDTRMRELGGTAPGAEPLKVAVLAALRLADEAREIRKTLQERESMLCERIEAMAQRVATALSSEGNDPPGRSLDGGLPLG